MNESWLRPNRRILLATSFVAVVFIAAGVLTGSLTVSVVGYLLGGVLAAVGVLLVVVTMRAAMRPRMARSGQTVTIASGWIGSAKFPLGDVEAFFLGQGPVVLPLLGEQSAHCTNLVVRLAQRAVEMQSGDVAPWVGGWADGYFTIRGTWCEPLDVSLVNDLNEQLALAKKSAAPDGSRS